MGAHVVAEGLHVPEGPAVLDDGTWVFTEQTAGRISGYDSTGVRNVAYVGGAPNSCVPGLNGDLYVCQNGGVVGSWRSSDPRVPGIQRVAADGTVTTIRVAVYGRPFVAPNDLAFGPDGTLYVTDPAQAFDPDHRLDAGEVLALGPGSGRLLSSVGGVYCNGIAVDDEGAVVWVESYTRAVRSVDGAGRVRTWCLLPEGEVPDGFAVAQDGRLFIATCGSHAISIVGPDGEHLGQLRFDERANPTNCCFDGSNLIVTDFGMDFETQLGAGRLWVVPTDAQGARVHRGTL